MKNLFHNIILLLFLFLQIFVGAQYTFNDAKKYSLDELKNEKKNELNFISKDADNPSFSKLNYDDKDWKKYKVTVNEEGKNGKIMWLRSYIKVDSTLVNKPLQIEVFQLGASEIFLDGKKIGSLGEISNNKAKKYAYKKTEPILISIADTNTHVIAIRLFPLPFSKLNEMVKFSTEVFSAQLLLADQSFIEKMEETEKFHQYTMLVCGFFLALSFIHFLLFAFYRKAIYNLFFALYNLSISYLTYLVLHFYKLDDPLLFSENTFKFLIGLAVFNISLSGFVNALFSKKKLRFRALLIIEIIALGLFYFSESASTLIILLVLFFVIIESLVLIIKAMFRKEKSAFIVGGGILTFLVYFILIILSSFFNFTGYSLDKNILSTFVLISFPLSISAYLGWQYASTNLNLKKQLDEVNRLSEINLQQEQEKQQILQNQNDLLEKQVDERTQELKTEKQKTEDLLLNILPQEVAEELKNKGSSEAKNYDEVSVLFTDFVSFTQNSEKMGAERMLKELNDCFTAFDMIMEKHGLEKIKTIGDAYMAVCGLPHHNPDHAYQTVLAALDIIEFIENRKKYNPETLDIRIGVNSGSLIAGIVGVKKFAYDIWGDTVNTAARMEQSSQKGRVNISDSTYQLVKEKIECEYRGKIEVKGKGELDMYFANEKL